MPIIELCGAAKTIVSLLIDQVGNMTHLNTAAARPVIVCTVLFARLSRKTL